MVRSTDSEISKNIPTNKSDIKMKISCDTSEKDNNLNNQEKFSSKDKKLDIVKEEEIRKEKMSDKNINNMVEISSVSEQNASIEMIQSEKYDRLNDNVNKNDKGMINESGNAEQAYKDKYNNNENLKEIKEENTVIPDNVNILESSELLNKNEKGSRLNKSSSIIDQKILDGIKRNIVEINACLSGNQTDSTIKEDNKCSESENKKIEQKNNVLNKNFMQTNKKTGEKNNNTFEKSKLKTLRRSNRQKTIMENDFKKDYLHLKENMTEETRAIDTNNDNKVCSKSVKTKKDGLNDEKTVNNKKVTFEKIEKEADKKIQEKSSSQGLIKRSLNRKNRQMTIMEGDFKKDFIVEKNEVSENKKEKEIEEKTIEISKIATEKEKKEEKNSDLCLEKQIEVEKIKCLESISPEIVEKKVVSKNKEGKISKEDKFEFDLVLIDGKFDIVDQRDATKKITKAVKFNKFNLIHPKELVGNKNIHVSKNEAGSIFISGMFCLVIRQKDEKTNERNKDSIWKRYSKSFIMNLEAEKNQVDQNIGDKNICSIFYNVYIQGIPNNNVNEERLIGELKRVLNDQADKEKEKSNNFNSFMKNLIIKNQSLEVQDNSRHNRGNEQRAINSGSNINGNHNASGFEKADVKDIINKFKLLEKEENHIYSRKLKKNRQKTNEKNTKLSDEKVSKIQQNDEKVNVATCKVILDEIETFDKDAITANISNITTNNDGVLLKKNMNSEPHGSVERNQEVSLKVKLFEKAENTISDINTISEVISSEKSIKFHKSKEEIIVDKNNNILEDKPNAYEGFKIDDECDITISEVKPLSEKSISMNESETPLITIKDKSNRSEMIKCEEKCLSEIRTKTPLSDDKIELLPITSNINNVETFEKEKIFSDYIIIQQNAVTKKKSEENIQNDTKKSYSELNTLQKSRENIEYDFYYNKPKFDAMNRFKKDNNDEKSKNYSNLTLFQKKEMIIFCSKEIEKKNTPTICKFLNKIRMGCYKPSEDKYLAQKEISNILIKVAEALQIRGIVHNPSFEYTPFKYNSYKNSGFEFELNNIPIDDLVNIFIGLLKELNGILPNSIGKSILKMKKCSDQPDRKNLNMIRTYLPLCLSEEYRNLYMYLDSLIYKLISCEPDIARNRLAYHLITSMFNSNIMDKKENEMLLINSYLKLNSSVEFEKIDSKLFEKFSKKYIERENRRISEKN